MTFLYLLVILVAFYLLLVAEFLLPTGGLLGAAAVATLIAAIAIAFSHSILLGTGVVLFLLLTTPAVLMGLVRAWPHTPIGRRMLNRRPGERAGVAPRKTTSGGTPVDDLIGRIGVAKSDLLPSGLIVLDGEKLDAISTGMPIDAGTKVIVTHVELGKVHVRAATDDESPKSETAPPNSPPSLEESIESYDVE